MAEDRQIEQGAAFLQLLGLDARRHQIAQRRRAAIGSDHLDKAGAMRGGRGVLADRKKRQLQ